jgi:hypothetical protein
LKIKCIFGLFAITVLLLTACADLQRYRADGVMPVASGSHGVNHWLEELYDTHSMTPEELQLALKYREQTFLDNPDTENRVQLALLLATGSKPVRDQERALQLLAGIDQQPVSVSDRELITVLQQFLDEQREITEQMDSLRNKVMVQGKRIDELEEQQRALTTIEQNIQQREDPVGTDNGN